MRAFDAEAIAKRELTLIGAGTAVAVTHDLRSAARAGSVSTGHATQPGGDPYGPHPTNLVLAGGGAPTLDDLIAPIERGIFVTRFWYVNPVEEHRTLLTGMTRDGTFLIEDGRLAEPLKELRFTDSILRLLSATEELTTEQRLCGEPELYGQRHATGVLTPALRASGFRVTGVAP
jgi:predicted Zn-dependent protease